MKWFRRHIKTGSRLALFALAIQLALSFGHFHFEPAQAGPAVQIGLSDVDLSSVDGVVPTEASQQPSDHHDSDRHPATNCAICAVLSLAGNLLLSTPPVLLLPDAVELLYLATDAEFVHLGSARLPFQSRAPPVS
ncbi:DUF2946 domain-containing protein [Bradyrhizobium lablabi]|uniref:DUF2946 domain-containing protein n=1 Tax=Bradyrhizobium lablabi TaxID=722472 RepID=UPI001BA486D5|nr:DUF2946 domain-containing protein [Bradyrhizobium lablabi]MBR1120402.1 DUF2946 domain-containing protein [Bradyrhizobium lablabi]